MFIDKALLAVGVFLMVIGTAALSSGSFEMSSRVRPSYAHVDGCGAGVAALIVIGVGAYCVLRSFRK